MLSTHRDGYKIKIKIAILELSEGTAALDTFYCAKLTYET